MYLETPKIQGITGLPLRSFAGFLRPFFRTILVILYASMALLASASASYAGRSTDGEWGPVIPWPHVAVSAASLPDGRILSWSGSERFTWPTTEQTYSSTWNPLSGEFIEIFHPTHNMFCASVAMTPGGDVFVSGGRNMTNSPWTSLFNYQDSQWTQIENMSSGGRWYATSVQLSDGDIFTAIGTATNKKYPDRWDPISGWQTQNNIDFNAMILDPFGSTYGEVDWWPLLHVAPNGELFHSGPTPQMHWINTEGNGSFQQSGSQFTDWYHKHGTTVMYDEGKLLTAGGWVGGNDSSSTNKAFTIDISGTSPAVQLTDSMTHKRKFHNGVILPTGEVLVVGGNTSGVPISDTGSILDAEVWNPQTGVWRLLAPMSVPRNYHSTALLLTDGRVISAGGGYDSSDANEPATHSDGQVYSPAYLFDADDSIATRPVITDSPAEVDVGETFNVTTDSDIAYFSLIKMSSTTHGMNTDLRFFKPSFTSSGANSYQVVMHANPNIATPGYWMLFAVDNAGVPSESQVLQIEVEENAAGDILHPYFEYFEGTWTVLPDFDALVPIATGDVDSFHIGPALQSDDFGFRISARIVLDQSGDYTFYSASNDGTQLFVNGALVVDNDGIHGVVEQQGTVNLAAGVHDIVLTYFQRGGSSDLQVSYTGPGVPKQVIPASILIDPAFGQPQIDPIITNPIEAGTDIEYAVSASGATPLQYSWSFGDGSAETDFVSETNITHSFTAPGRYTVIVTARDEEGVESKETFVQLIHAPLTTTQPVASTSIIEYAVQNQVWNVNPDNDSVSVIDTNTTALMGELAVGDEPHSLAIAPDGRVWVVNEQDASISIIDASTLTVVQSISLRVGSQPYGLVFGNGSAYVVLQTTGEVVRLDDVTGAELNRVSVGPHPRHLSLDTGAQILYVSRYITPPLPGESSASPVVDDGIQSYGGEVLRLNAGTLASIDTIILQHNNSLVTEHTGPGLPNYLGAPVISPDGTSAWVPSKQDNILAGTLRDGQALVFDQAVRAISSKIDLDVGQEELSARVDHDDASVASAAVFDPFGLHLFTALEGNRMVAVTDATTSDEILRFNVGRAPKGLAVSDDGSKLYVHNFMDRSVGIFDIAGLVSGASVSATEIATISTVSSESLSATVLNGKQLFYDSRDDRLAALDYMSCASCHNDGEQDGRVWDFTSFGEGLRNTASLKSGASTNGALHWTANFDEVQDFEGQIRNFAGGTGLMSDADFSSGTRSQPIGDPKAGLSTDLDALAAYVNSLTEVPLSPFREVDNSLSAEAQAGRLLFFERNCISCHTPFGLTDSSDGNGLHDIGTLKPGSGSRLGASLNGIDTPTLLGAWYTAPHLHDGSALTLRDAIVAHQNVSLSSVDLDQLESLLRQINDGNEILVAEIVSHVIDIRVGAGIDDAEEKPSGAVSLTSSDLELTTDGLNQLVGLRFTEVSIPIGAIITDAWVQFQADETSSSTTQLTLRAEAKDNPASFSTANSNLSNRARTGSGVGWNPLPWPNINEASAAQRTPGIATVIQEVVSRPGWQAGQAIVVLIDGTGRRTAESFNGNASAAPLLHIEYIDGVPPVDSDGDGAPDNLDVFPDDPNEAADTDGDGVGDNADAFPADPTETIDSDGDGVGDNADVFPNDPNEAADTDGDGIGDNADAFPTDSTETTDTDGDGVGDNTDAFPTDPTEATDTDGDGIGDNADAFPTDPTETTDTDGDGVGDNTDVFPNDPAEGADTDGDGVGDNTDAFPTDPTETIDTDGDGVGDNTDVFPNDPSEVIDTDGDGVGDNADAFPADSTETTDTDGDGVGDNTDVFPNDPSEVIDTDGDGVGDNADAFPADPTETTDTDGDGVGDNTDVFPNDPNEVIDTDGDGVGDNADAFPADPTETTDTDSDGVGDNTDVFPTRLMIRAK